MSRTAARIVIAEPWAVLRRGLVGVLQPQFLVVGDVEHASDLRPLVRSRPVDVAIVGADRSIDMVAVVSEFGVTAGGPPVIVLSDDIQGDSLRALLRAGANAVMTKRVESAELLDAVRRVLDGDRVVDQGYLPLLYGDLDEVPDVDDEPSLLTRRERDVLAELARGSSNREIATALVVGESTVKTHLARIYAKLEVEGRHKAVGRALELGILS